MYGAAGSLWEVNPGSSGTQVRSDSPRRTITWLLETNKDFYFIYGGKRRRV